MQISKLTIKNFRSFGPEGAEIELKHKLTAFIGLNSSGKTTALEALRKLFGITSGEREIRREDFHIGQGEDPDEMDERTLSIEVRIEFSEGEKEAIPAFFSYMVVEKENGDPYLRMRLEATWKKSHTIYGDVDVCLYYIRVPEGEEETEDSKRVCPNHQRSLIEVFYVPAIRRPSEQIKFASGSILYRVLKHIKMDEKFSEEFEKHVAAINGLFKELSEFDTIQKTLNSFWEQFHKDERYRESNLGFSSSDINSILKKLEVSFSPTGTHRTYQVDDLGEGYRSLFYLTLVCSLLDFENNLPDDGDYSVQRPLLTIVAIEEPENHIAPQLLGRIIKILLGIAHQDNSQVLLSSHTPAIIRRLYPESIRHFRINKEYQSEVNQITLPAEETEAYKYIKEAIQNYPELYFARLVVIGEGDSEQVIMNKMMHVYEKDFDDNFICFVPLGHRFVNHIWKLLDTLHIPYVTLLDLDKERGGGGWGRVKYVLNQLLDLGKDKSDLLGLADGSLLSDEEFSKMHTWDITDEAGLRSWVSFLEKYDVYFSSPLDIDFLFLEHYPELYKGLVKKGEGPRIPDKSKDAAGFEKKVTTAVQATLKSEEVEGKTYTDEQKELMIWYNYHFLGRGKPITHLRALAKVDDETLKEKMPEAIGKLFAKIQSKLHPANEVHTSSELAAR